MTQTVQVPAPFLPTEGQIRTELRDLQAKVVSGDLDGARALERFIWEGALEAIASGNAQAGYLAAAALETTKISFLRY